MNQPTAIIVKDGMGRPVNPFPRPISRHEITDWDVFEQQVHEHPCPSMANTEPGKTVMAELRSQKREKDNPAQKEFIDCDPNQEPMYPWCEFRQIWVPIVEQKEGEGKPTCGSGEKSYQTEIRIGKDIDVCLDTENKLLIITDGSLSFLEFTIEEAHQLRRFLNTLTL
jgi:hypothetical protein